MTVHKHLLSNHHKLNVYHQSLHIEHYIKNSGSKAFLHKYTTRDVNLNLNLHPLTQ